MVRIFRHYVPSSFLVLGFIEVLVLMAAVYGGISIRFGGDLAEAGESFPVFPNALTFAIVTILAMTSMGLYERHLREGTWGMVVRILGALLISFLLMSMVFYLLPSLALWRGALGLSWLLALMGILGVRLAFAMLVDQEKLKRRILVLGTGKKAAMIDQLLRRKSDRRGFTIVGYVHFPREHGVVKKNTMQHDSPFLELVRRNHVDEIVVALDDRRKSFPMEEIVDCRMAGVDVIDLMTFFERQAGKLPLALLQPGWLVYSDGFRNSTFRIYAKRAFDLFISSLALLLTWPIMLAAAMAIRLEDGGAVFYRQQRVGQDGRVFDVLKFRSMRPDAEKDGKARWASEGDDRITRVGAFIRRTRIDELPQIFNVLMGDMSFVGPRPERPEFVEELARKIPYYAERHRVKPGITGWAQICYPYGASERDAEEKLQYDLYYVKNYSLFLDLMILFQTLQVVIWGKGAR
ncbi:MAG TPA: TIGR03013 family PEP-CTERM/XrtA system glycosyltransferase [Gammaproteobacteria bacterium]|nr:TIGR03013 family PEP-CTERM/XrtA system glycosyltransferase [Gammaproteobacteria bacterium]